jgi:mono/diheme cytochrome c family protein
MNLSRASTFALCAVFLLTLALTACDSGQPASPPVAAPASAPESAPAPAAEPAATPEPAPAPAAEPVAAPEPAPAPAPEPVPAPDAVQDTAPAAPSTPAADASTGPSTTDPKADPAVAGPAPVYDVSCPAGATQAEKCQVGKDTYVGWRSFATHCVQCHGGSAMGSTFAPNLAERLKTRVDWLRFHYVMHHGYTGKVGAMPSFAKNNAVLKDMGPIYSYLLARADNALPPGRPVKKP